jgi:hypothetical protein
MMIIYICIYCIIYIYIDLLLCRNKNSPFLYLNHMNTEHNHHMHMHLGAESSLLQFVTSQRANEVNLNLHTINMILHDYDDDHNIMINRI